MCNKHYRHTLLRERAAKGDLCSVDGCDEPRYNRGLCGMHNHRLHRFGDVGIAERHKRESGMGHIDRNGYVTIHVDGKRQLAHRWVMEQQIGRTLMKNEYVHHRNGVRSDNRPENLELCATWPGQRLDDLIEFLVERYPDRVKRA